MLESTYTTYVNAETAVSYTFNGDTNPLHGLDIKVAQRTVTGRTKQQAHGEFATFTARGGMTIDAVGDLFADTSTDYIVARKAMIAALFGTPTTAITAKKTGRLTVRWAGDTQNSWADVTVLNFSAPIEGSMPSLTPYMITFYAFEPYWTYFTSGTKYFFS